MVSRNPPKKVRELLRKEVNFGCPVMGCGNPHLTYHHFAPTWKVKEHHNPDGMIALCTRHAALADGGRWKNHQLLQMKAKPFVNQKRVREFYGIYEKTQFALWEI
jgi:hypothetical protein